jgi:hypothetical protein
MSLTEEFRRIKREHRKALRYRAALVMGPSVTRVFRRGTKKALIPALEAIDVDRLRGVRSQQQFREWFDEHLAKVARGIRRLNAHNDRVNPGYKWGHATKVLTLFVREIVLCSRYFSDAEAKRLSPWLYAPIDGIIIRRLERLGECLPFDRIRQIDTPRKFYGVQERLGEAAAAVGVPRVWFDDNWGDRQ